MICPRCSSQTRVTHTTGEGEVVRRRVCTSCRFAFKTRELTADAIEGIAARARRKLAEMTSLINES